MYTDPHTKTHHAIKCITYTHLCYYIYYSSYKSLLFDSSVRRILSFLHRLELCCSTIYGTHTHTYNLTFIHHMVNLKHALKKCPEHDKNVLQPGSAFVLIIIFIKLMMKTIFIRCQIENGITYDVLVIYA